MSEIMSIGQLLLGLHDQLVLGIEMFGYHAIWIWALPPIWGIALCLIWMNMLEEEEKSERMYVAYAEKNLPQLRELAKQRSAEILDIKSVKRRHK